MSDDTQIGGPSGRFPPTRWSAIVAARGDDPAERTRAFETIVAAYWKPVYKYIRARWGKNNEAAKDLTQEFFARVMEKGLIDPRQSRSALEQSAERTPQHELRPHAGPTRAHTHRHRQRQLLSGI